MQCWNLRILKIIHDAFEIDYDIDDLSPPSHFSFSFSPHLTSNGMYSIGWLLPLDVDEKVQELF